MEEREGWTDEGEGGQKGQSAGDVECAMPPHLDVKYCSAATSDNDAADGGGDGGASLVSSPVHSCAQLAWHTTCVKSIFWLPV
jgi:hypothetical protein